MEKFMASLIFSIFLVITASPGNATFINFDSYDPDTNIDGLNLGGVTITSLSGSTFIAGTPSYGVGYRSPSNAITNTGFITDNSMTFTFDYVVNFIEFTGGDMGGDIDQFYVDFFDNDSNILSTIDTGFFGGNPVDTAIMVDFYTVNINQEGIKYFVVRDAINAGIGIDDLTFTASTVPEPTTMVLVAAGLVGLLGVTRRNRQ